MAKMGYMGQCWAANRLAYQVHLLKSATACLELSALTCRACFRMPTEPSAIASLPCWPLIGARTLFQTCMVIVTFINSKIRSMGTGILQACGCPSLLPGQFCDGSKSNRVCILDQELCCSCQCKWAAQLSCSQRTPYWGCSQVSCSHLTACSKLCYTPALQLPSARSSGASPLQHRPEPSV